MEGLLGKRSSRFGGFIQRGHEAVVEVSHVIRGSGQFTVAQRVDDAAVTRAWRVDVSTTCHVYARPSPWANTVSLGCQIRLHRDPIPIAVVLLLEVGNNVLQKHDHALALCLRRGAPLLAARAFVRNLELEASQRGCIVIRRSFGGILMCEHIPVVLGADRHT